MADDLWLSANLKHASLERTAEPGLDRSLSLFREGGFDALAGLRPWLITNAQNTIPKSRVLDGQFTSVQQSIGVPRHLGDGGASLYLERFVEESKSSGFVQALIDEYRVNGKLSVAA